MSTEISENNNGILFESDSMEDSGMNYDRYIDLLIAVIKQAYKDASKGDEHAEHFVDYYLGGLASSEKV